MLAYIFFTCLIIQIALSLKLYMSNPYRRLNIYLSLIPGFFIFIVVIEIILYYITDVVQANQLFWIYQYISILPTVFLLLSVIEYIKNYTKNYSIKFLNIVILFAIIINSLWFLFLLLNGATAHIYLAKPHLWTIDYNHLNLLFFLYNYSTILWLIFSLIGFIYLARKANSKQKKWWFRILSFLEIIIISSFILLINTSNNNNNPQYYFIATIPSTFLIILNVWVLSNFTIFDITPKNIYGEVLASINDWIIVLDENGKISYINIAASSKTTYSFSDIINMNIDKLIEIKDTMSGNAANWKVLQKTLHNNFTEITVKFNKSEKIFNLQSSLKKILLPDKTEVFLWVLIDTMRIAALKINKNIIEAKNIELGRAYSDIEFIINMTSHDLKVPLKTIIELTNLVKIENEISGINRSVEYLDYISSISNQSLLLTTQMIEYMRIGVFDKKMAWHPTADIINKVKERLFIQITQNNALIIYRGIDKIYCDVMQMQELLGNFIDNAIKYRGINAPIISIAIVEFTDKYAFVIKDNGIGIEESFISKLFSKYNRAPKNNIQGNGIGLYLCKKIIEANDGKIKISNNKEDGITIEFEISKF